LIGGRRLGNENASTLYRHTTREEFGVKAREGLLRLEVWFGERFPVTDRDGTLYQYMIRYPRIVWKDYVTIILHIPEFCAPGLPFCGGWRLGVGYDSRYTLPLLSQTALGKDRTRERGSDRSQYPKVTTDIERYQCLSFSLAHLPTHLLPRLYNIYIYIYITT